MSLNPVDIYCWPSSISEDNAWILIANLKPKYETEVIIWDNDKKCKNKAILIKINNEDFWQITTDSITIKIPFDHISKWSYLPLYPVYE